MPTTLDWQFWVLRELDQVAYLRFASVYQNFDSLDDFAQAVEDLRHSHKDDER